MLLEVGSLEVGQIWIDKFGNAVDIIGFENAYDFQLDNGIYYRVAILENLENGNTVAVAENIVEGKYTLIEGGTTIPKS